MKRGVRGAGRSLKTGWRVRMSEVWTLNRRVITSRKTGELGVKGGEAAVEKRPGCCKTSRSKKKSHCQKKIDRWESSVYPSGGPGKKKKSYAWGRQAALSPRTLENAGKGLKGSTPRGD